MNKEQETWKTATEQLIHNEIRYIVQEQEPYIWRDCLQARVAYWQNELKRIAMQIYWEGNTVDKTREKG